MEVPVCSAERMSWGGLYIFRPCCCISLLHQSEYVGVVRLSAWQYSAEAWWGDWWWWLHSEAVFELSQYQNSRSWRQSPTASPVLEFQAAASLKALDVMTPGKHEQPQDAGKLVRKPFISRRQSIWDDLSRNNNGGDNNGMAFSLAQETSFVMKVEFPWRTALERNGRAR